MLLRPQSTVLCSVDLAENSTPPDARRSGLKGERALKSRKPPSRGRGGRRPKTVYVDAYPPYVRDFLLKDEQPSLLSESSTRISWRVRQVMASLSSQQQTLLIRRFFDQAPLSEIAQERGVSYQAVQSQLRTAISEFIAQMAALGFGYTDVPDDYS